MALLLAFAGLGATALLKVVGAPRPHPMVGQPFPAIDSVVEVPCAREWPAAPFRGPDVLIYVSIDCRYCRAQMAAWNDLLAQRGGAAPRVVLAPGETPDSASVPPRLRSRTTLDHRGAIARALDVDRVPVTVFVDGEGTVVARVEGRQSEAEMTRLLADIGALSPHPPQRGCA